MKDWVVKIRFQVTKGRMISRGFHGARRVNTRTSGIHGRYLYPTRSTRVSNALQTRILQRPIRNSNRTTTFTHACRTCFTIGRPVIYSIPTAYRVLVVIARTIHKSCSQPVLFFLFFFFSRTRAISSWLCENSGRLRAWPFEPWMFNISVIIDIYCAALTLSFSSVHSLLSNIATTCVETPYILFLTSPKVLLT